MVIEESLDQFFARHLQAKGETINTVLNDPHGVDLASVLGSEQEAFEEELAARVARWREMREVWG
jgi:hypothetical protein